MFFNHDKVFTSLLCSKSDSSSLSVTSSLNSPSSPLCSKHWFRFQVLCLSVHVVPGDNYFTQNYCCSPWGKYFFMIPGHLRSWSVALTHSVSYTFCFSFYRPRWPYFFRFIPCLVPSVNWIGHEAAILPSMCEYSNPDPDLIKLPHQILSDIRTDSCLYSVGPSYKMTDRTAGPPIFDTSDATDPVTHKSCNLQWKIFCTLWGFPHHFHHWSIYYLSFPISKHIITPTCILYPPPISL
jgi:hypothetical protein